MAAPVVLRMEDCNITTSAHGDSGVWVKSGKATLIRNHIHDCGLNGVVLENSQAKAVLEDNTIDNCGLFSPTNSMTGVPFPAIHIKSGAEVTARGNRITNNAGFGVRVAAGGKGEFQDNDLRGNRKGAWDINKRSLPNVQRLGNHE
jgi:parallel beta-helix repeat protein